MPLDRPVRLASALFTWRPRSAALRLGLILMPIVLVGVGWCFYREHSNHTARPEAPAAISPPPEIASRIPGRAGAIEYALALR